MRTCSANKCIFPVWGTDKKTGQGYCKNHQYLRTDTDKRSSFQKHMDKMKEKEPQDDETELQKWYAAIMEKETGVCWETTERIDKRTKEELIAQHSDWTDAEIEKRFKKIQFGWHGSIAHILSKGDYPSVATHPQNYMILKMWGGAHGQYDASWEKAAKMKVWPYAVKIINILYPLLTREEKAKLPDIVIQEIKPELYNTTQTPKP